MRMQGAGRWAWWCACASMLLLLLLLSAQARCAAEAVRAPTTTACLGWVGLPLLLLWQMGGLLVLCVACGGACERAQCVFVSSPLLLAIPSPLAFHTAHLRGPALTSAAKGGPLWPAPPRSAFPR